MSLIRSLVLGLIILLPAGAVSAVTWTVEQIGGCSDSSCYPCCTIQGAVYKSVGGDTISVAPGNYPEIIDFRNMLSVGDITLEAASGPGTVMISSSADEPLRHSGTYTNTVTLDGLDITSGGGYSCVYFNHLGNAVLRDVTANDCDYTAIMLDNPGSVTMERCTANSSGRTGIQIDGASSTSVIDCTANSNVANGFDVYSLGSIDLINPTAVGNLDGLKVVAVAPTAITGATVTDNGRTGVIIESSSTLTLSASSITGSYERGIDIGSDVIGPADSVILTNVDVSNNGYGFGDSGLRMRYVSGPVVITNSSFNDNGFSGEGDGFTVETSVVGDLEVYGGGANGNADDGFDLRVTGNATFIGATANTNGEDGVVAEIPGTVFFQDCVANGNQTGSGFDIQWQEPDRLDGASVIDCTAHDNGLAGGGNGIRVNHVSGPVTVTGARTNGNYWTGVRVDDAGGAVLIRDVTARFGLEDGIKIDADVGPVVVLDCTSESNVEAGLIVNREDVDVESLYVRRNTFGSNGATGVVLLGLGGTRLMSARCNDIAGNSFGMYLDGPVTVDAKKVWWGSTSGPSDQGPGTGDGIFAEAGGEILHSPWLMQSISSAITDCEMFGSGFESGLAEEWDAVVY